MTSRTAVLERVYAGLLGKAIGVRLGAPLEVGFDGPEHIRHVYGEIDGYVTSYSNFAADDDTNGLVFLTRDARLRRRCPCTVTAAEAADAWLNYTSDGRGMFWWGGYGEFTEHTAYVNLKRGVPAPACGSALTNGAVLSEQIGAQIFADGWGLLCPGDPAAAADCAAAAASVSHEGEGVNGARFIAACVARAFNETDVPGIIRAGLGVIPVGSAYAQAVRDVVEFHRNCPTDFRACLDFLRREHGYSRYGGAAPIVPNAGVVVLALLYGGGDFSKTVCIAAMCGWDTDCNAGNAGCIAGVAGGLDGIDSAWRGPINDVLIGSSAVGSLNIIDIPTLAREYTAANAIAGIKFDFELPGSTHGFRVSDAGVCRVSNSGTAAASGARSLMLEIAGLDPGGSVRAFYKPFYRRADFDDERYQPAFSPLIVPGQRVKAKVMAVSQGGLPDSAPTGLHACLYARDTVSHGIVRGPAVVLEGGAWSELSFTISNSCAGAVDEVGVELASPTGAGACAAFVDDFRADGDVNYRIDFSREANEWGGVTQFTTSAGHWRCDQAAGVMRAAGNGMCEAFTGPHYMGDVAVEATVTPLDGPSHNLNVRVQGCSRSYAAGLAGRGRAAVFKNAGGYRLIAERPFAWEHGRDYRVRVEAEGRVIRLFVDGAMLLECRDDSENAYSRGCVGMSMLEKGSALYRDIAVVSRGEIA